MRCEPVKQWSDLALGLEVALSVALLGNLEALLHPFDELLGRFFRQRAAELGVLLLASFLKLLSLGNVKGI